MQTFEQFRKGTKLHVRMYRGILYGLANIFNGVVLLFTLGLYYSNIDTILIFHWAKKDISDYAKYGRNITWIGEPK